MIDGNNHASDRSVAAMMRAQKSEAEAALITLNWVAPHDWRRPTQLRLPRN